MADPYLVTCWNCLGEFDAVPAVWCSDDPKNPTKLCPFCLRCFCDASAEYKTQFWKSAPALLVEELQTLTRSEDRLGDILVRMKKITIPQLLEALAEQRDTGRKFGEVLLAHGYVSAHDLESALRTQGVTRLHDTRAGDGAGAYWQSNPDATLDYLLALGARKRASDLSIEPQADQVAIRFRIDGFAFRVEPVPKAHQTSLERALFAMFGLDPGHRARPQTGRATARLGGDEYDLILQLVPATHGMNATIRLVNRTTFVKDFTTLGLELEDRVRVVEEIRSGSGLLLVTAPPFNGGITTVYSILSYLAQGQRDVLSIESPIQWKMDGVRQVEVEPRPGGAGTEEALRGMIAVRPDALVISALPDVHTATLIVKLASSLLVVAHMTAASAARGLVALRDLGVPAHLVAGGLGLATGQRLVRTICRICRVPADPPAAQTLAAHGIDAETAAAMSFFKGKGCPTCNTIGYRGRRAVFETLPGGSEVRAAVESGASAEEVGRIAVESGTITVRERCLALVREGVTTFEEFARLRL